MDLPSGKKLHCCGKGFSTKSSFKAHMLTNHASGHKCEECGLVFACRTLLLRHRSIHTHIRRFPCSHCTYLLSPKSNVKRFIDAKHTNEEAIVMCDPEGINPTSLANNSMNLVPKPNALYNSAMEEMDSQAVNGEVSHEFVIEEVDHEEIIEAVIRESGIEEVDHEKIIVVVIDESVIEDVDHEDTIVVEINESVIEEVDHEEIIVVEFDESVIEEMDHEEIIQAVSHESIIEDAVNGDSEDEYVEVTPLYCSADILPESSLEPIDLSRNNRNTMISTPSADIDISHTDYNANTIQETTPGAPIPFTWPPECPYYSGYLISIEEVSHESIHEDSNSEDENFAVITLDRSADTLPEYSLEPIDLSRNNQNTMILATMSSASSAPIIPGSTLETTNQQRYIEKLYMNHTRITAETPNLHTLNRMINGGPKRGLRNSHSGSTIRPRQLFQEKCIQKAPSENVQFHHDNLYNCGAPGGNNLIPLCQPFNYEPPSVIRPTTPPLANCPIPQRVTQPQLNIEMNCLPKIWRPYILPKIWRPFKQDSK